MSIFVADFETCNNDINIEQGYTRVWLWDLCEIDSLAHYSGENFEQFFEQIKDFAPATIYTHNLKFDGNFVLHYLLSNNFKHVKSRKLESREFSTLITSGGVFYSIKICFETKSKKKKRVIEFRDSSKKIKGSVERIAKSYKLPILKGEIDYKKYRPIGYIASKEEYAYIRNDTEIIARVLKGQYNDDMCKMTTSSDAMYLFKKSLPCPFKQIFPVLDIDIDDFIRASYRGGVVLVGEKYKNRIINENVNVYDINSMYPHKLAHKLMPYGKPSYYKGKYEATKSQPLYIQRIAVCCKLKNGFLPTVLLNNVRWGALTYLENTDGEMYEMTLTNVDLELLFKHYEIYDIEYIDGYAFYASKSIFKKYVLPVYDKKCNTVGAEKENEKLKLNGLYGKFAFNPKNFQKYPYMENDKIHYQNGDMELSEPIYTAVSSFVTAYSREQLFKYAQLHYDNFVYCDTDSLHLTCELELEYIDSKKLGFFKFEKTYIKSKYLAQKSYYGITADNKNEIKLAGCPDNVKQQITFERFKFGETFKGKLLPKIVNGGVVLCDTEFTIKERIKHS